jgi:hypothetical protein
VPRTAGPLLAPPISRWSVANRVRFGLEFQLTSGSTPAVRLTPGVEPDSSEDDPRPPPSP